MRFLYILFIIFSFSAIAQTVDRDSFEVGVEAFNAGNYEEALRIMKKHEKEQPSAAYVVKVSTLMLQKEGKHSAIYPELVKTLLQKGDNSIFEKLGLIQRFKGEVSGMSGAMYVQSLRSAVNRGNANAALQLGLLSQEGIGIQKNYRNAVHYFEIAAKSGNAIALNSLGVYYRFGIGVKEDKIKAKDYLKQAVLKENLDAFYNLALMYSDEKNHLEGFSVAELGYERIKKLSNKKIEIKFKKLFKKNKKNLSVFHQAYLKKYRPFWLKPLLNKNKDISTPELLPLPPERMIEETDFMNFITKDAYNNRYKKFAPLMPNWVSFDNPTEINPEIAEKRIPFLTPDDTDVINALYYRPSDKRYISLALNRKNSAIPAMVGDVITLYIYSPLTETKSTLKGGHFSIENTAYKMTILNTSGNISTNYAMTLTPLSKETNRTEAWISMQFNVLQAGETIIRFIPKNEKDFAYNLRIVAFQKQELD